MNAVEQFAAQFTKFDWDDVTAWTPTWAEIQGKAHLYKTAQLRDTGEFVKILHVKRNGFLRGEVIEGGFWIRHEHGDSFVSADQLCNFVL